MHSPKGALYISKVDFIRAMIADNLIIPFYSVERTRARWLFDDSFPFQIRIQIVTFEASLTFFINIFSLLLVTCGTD